MRTQLALADELNLCMKNIKFSYFQQFASTACQTRRVNRTLIATQTGGLLLLLEASFENERAFPLPEESKKEREKERREIAK